MLPRTPPSRVAIEDVAPCVDCGRVPIRRVAGDQVVVEADVFSDGTAGVRAFLRWQRSDERTWHRVPMAPMANDRWQAPFPVAAPGEYRYAVEAWVDAFVTWRSMLERRVAAGSVRGVDLQEGAQLLRVVAGRLRGADRAAVTRVAEAVEGAASDDLALGLPLARDEALDRILAAHPPPSSVARSDPALTVVVDPLVAQHSAWYELFPRSTSPVGGRPGTLRDLRARLPYIADLGFDVVYLPPVHPIGSTGRRGPNNTLPAPPGAPGSPWAIGAADGGHTAIHTELGDQEEFSRTVAEARALGIEIALDLALQCSPDHPWVREHPGWFSRLPDGMIRTAENPPKRYDDIYPLDFETPEWAELWSAVREIVEFWIRLGVRWFRVDNPHSKPFAFWEWLIREVRAAHPETMFLAEAFTRPKVMYHLAKVGFTHSYTYFTWRTEKGELEEYFREIGRGPVHEVFRPHLWTNTPDILAVQFHAGHRSVFLHRLILAATLASHYGIYGPVYELMEHRPREAGTEEYRDSEKYEVRHWNLDDPRSLAPEVRRVNRIRRDHPALRAGSAPHFHGIDNAKLLAYSRRTDDRSDVVLVVVNLDPTGVQSGWTWLDLDELGLADGPPFGVKDLLSGESYTWSGKRNFVRLDPGRWPAHVLHVVRPDPPNAGSNGAR